MRGESRTMLDAWLHAVLARNFGEAAEEAVPDELMRLLPQDEDVLTA